MKRDYMPSSEELESLKHEKSGPVKTTFDLKRFTVFDGASGIGRREKWITVRLDGRIYLSHEIGKTFPPEVKLEALLNSPGNIILVRESRKGITVRSAYRGHSQARAFRCHALKERLVNLGVNLPVRFIAEWDDEQKMWVGRRENG